MEFYQQPKYENTGVEDGHNSGSNDRRTASHLYAIKL